MGTKRFCVFEYLYRDADNFKAWGALLLKGVLSHAQVAEMKYKFESETFFIAEQIGVPPLYQELWAYSDGATESDHPWHEFFTVRPANENDLAMGAPWGTASALFQAITKTTRWNERLSSHYEIGCSQFPMFGNGQTR
ncbi:MAG: hypothetical protein HZB40_12035 [Rhodocyclales bacterium]|nr:hypothetical protein [Rhodocyclales bacterium]